VLFVFVIGWVVTWVRLAAARLPGDVVSAAFDGRQLLGIGLKTVFFMALVFAGASLVAYLAAGRNWAANSPDWHRIVRAEGVGAAHEQLSAPDRHQAWERGRERELARGQARREDRRREAAAALHLKRLADLAGRRHDRAQQIVDAAEPAAPAKTAEAQAEQPAEAPLGDRVVRIVAGFNVLLIAIVFGLAAGRLADVIPGASWITLVVAVLVALAIWGALTHFGPLFWRPWMHVVAWILVAAAVVLVAAPLGLLLAGSVAVATFGRRMARWSAPHSPSELLRSPLPWVLLGFYTLVAAAYYATPPVAFPRAVVSTSDGERIGGYIGRSSAGVYLATCTPLADATSTGERAELIPAASIRRVALGGPAAQLDSGERPSLAALGLSALGVDAHVGTLVRAELRARRATCAGAPPRTLTAAAEDPALGAGTIVDAGPPSATAHDGEPPVGATSPPSVAALARLYEPTIELSVADRFWPVSVGAVLADRGRDGQRTCLVRPPNRGCATLTRLSELSAKGASKRDFLRFPAARESNPSGQFRAFLAGQYVFPGSDHRWLADPGLLYPWYTAQVYFFYAGALTSPETWPRNARNSDVEPGLLGLEYWFFYPYNYYPTVINSALMEEAPVAGDESNTDLHQGDWEHITVLLDPRTYTPRWLYMARHADEGTFLPWDSPTLAFDGTHPIVQGALGGHPTYDNHCGARPRGRVWYLSADWVVCGSGRYAFRGATTPLVDLARTNWGCWPGRFGEATKWPANVNVVEESDNVVDKGLELVYAPGPRSPLWQAENEKLLHGKDICAGDPRRPEDEALSRLSAAGIH
jgi:hypothetical protein